jgi:endonuclease-8
VPEGDTIFRTARTLDRALAGSRVSRFASLLPQLASLPVPGPVEGRTVDRVEPRGKHVLVHFSGALVLRTHLRMHGSWHIYRPGERWRAPRRDARIEIGTAEWVAVGFRIPVAEWLTEHGVARHPVLTALGPDLLAESFDPAIARARLVALGETPIADALLDQRAMAGLGNVYKSEVLFACRVNPFRPVASLDAATIDAIVRESMRLIRLNVRESSTAPARGRRTTGRLAPDQGLWVYRRARQACYRCGAKIQVRRSGTDARSTYWCPQCQPE